MKYWIALTTLAQLAACQFVPAPTDLTSATGYAGIDVRYKLVPQGICELDPNVKSYTGYADVGTNEHLFFWFFESRDVNASTAPLTVWINGGPGSSSMIGLFNELGPCRITENYTVVSNPYSWSNVSNMLFIDQPTSVGFSYTSPVNAYQTKSGDIITLPGDDCPVYAQKVGDCGTYSYSNASLVPNATAAAAPYMWKALQGFMGAFPQYSRNGFHFATESYGGHYGPIFNEYFETQNSLNIPGAHKISLQSVSIGNGWYDPLIQYQAYYNFTVYPGNTYDFAPFGKVHEAQMYNALYGAGNCVDRLEYCAASGQDDVCSAADDFCANQVEEVLDKYAHRDEYDIRELDPDPFPESYWTGYLNTPKVQRAVGAYTNYSAYSYTVGAAFGSTGDDGREDGTIAAVQALLSQGVYILQYAGDADYNCNWLGGQVVAGLIDAPGFTSAGFADIATPDGITHGVVKQAANYAFARIYESGHEVPFYQPVAALSIFQRALTATDIATGKVHAGSGYLSKGPAESTYREGNATVQFKVTPACATYNTTTNAPDYSSCKNGTSTAKLAKRASSNARRENRRARRRSAFVEGFEDAAMGWHVPGLGF